MCSGKMFVKVFGKVSDPPYNSKNFKLYFSYLLKYLKKDSNVLSYNGKHINNKTLSEILGFGDSLIDKFIAESIRIKAIARVKIGKHTSYVVNPVYAFNGRYINISLYEIFSNSLDFLECLTKADVEYINNKYKENIYEKIRELKKGEDK